MPHWVQVLQDWQSLAGGLLAIVAAVVGGFFVLIQTGEARKQEERRIARRHAATRATMPLALSAICDYSRNCIEILESILARAQGHGIPSAPTYPGFPDLPPDVVPQFSDIVESATTDASNAAVELLREIQIVHARLRTPNRDLVSSSSIVTTLNVESNIVDCIELYARAETLFDYARGKASAPEGVTAERVFNTLGLVGIHSPSQYMQDTINWRAQRRATVPPARSSVSPRHLVSVLKTALVSRFKFRPKE